MARSRWGGFSRGLRTYIQNWINFRTSNATSVEAPTDPTSFDYTTIQGIWNLNSTVQFKKGNASSSGSGGGSTPSYSLGLSSSLDNVTGQNAAWSQRSVDISAYAGATVRLVFHYTNGSGFTGDIQLDQINLDGTTYTFESTTESFETNGGNESTYNTVTWYEVITSFSSPGSWSRDNDGTPSSGTGLTTGAAGTSWYLYAETSSPANVTGYNFWLRSPQVTLSGSPTLSYYEGRSGAGIGTLNVYIDVIS